MCSTHHHHHQVAKACHSKSQQPHAISKANKKMLLSCTHATEQKTQGLLTARSTFCEPFRSDMYAESAKFHRASTHIPHNLCPTVREKKAK
jgi:hypothetical protein